jgi:hypothetical protein
MPIRLSITRNSASAGVRCRQILKRHARILFGLDKSVLTRGQKYHFIAGWLPWVADAFNLLLTL